MAADFRLELAYLVTGWSGYVLIAAGLLLLVPVARSSGHGPDSFAYAANDGAVAAKASFDSAQAATPPAPAAGSRITGSVRNRSGTMASQASVPSAAARRAPRDWVRRMARIAAPAPG